MDEIKQYLNESLDLKILYFSTHINVAENDVCMKSKVMQYSHNLPRNSDSPVKTNY